MRSQQLRKVIFNVKQVKRYAVTSENIMKDGTNSSKTLWNAVYRNEIAKVQNLLRSGEALDLIDVKHGMWEDTCLHCAIRKGSFQIVRKLLDYRADLNSININGSTPLHLAVETQNIDIIKELLSAGPNLRKKNYTGKTARALINPACTEIKTAFELREKKNQSKQKKIEQQKLSLL